MERLDDSFWEVFRSSRNPMLLWDDRRRYREVNDAACECFGRPRENLLRHRVGDRTAGDLLARFEAVLPRLLESGSLTMPWAIVRPDSTRREVYLQAVAHVDEGLHLSIFLTAPPTLPADGLTPREREITGLLADGCDGREVAQRLVLSPETVRTHIRNAMQRAGARTRAHLIAIALREGLIDP